LYCKRLRDSVQIPSGSLWRVLRQPGEVVTQPYDALLLISFGGPEKRDDVLPFLQNVLRGKDVPAQRVQEVAEHYYLFDGVSPINAQNRSLLVSLVAELNRHGPPLPVYWGNRNWHPLLADVLEQMADDGIRRALAFVTSAFGCYSGCRQYLEDIARARETVGPQAPEVDKLRLFYNHPGFIQATADRLSEALGRVPADRRASARLIYTAHNIPEAMARVSPYVQQLREACQLVSQRAGRAEWELVYQSRSGPPSQPWLGPDLYDHVRALRAADPGLRDLVLVPIGFLCEHMEVIYDLDVAAGELCHELGLTMTRAGLVANHPRFVTMIRELILERIEPHSTRLAIGSQGPSPDRCPEGCCGDLIAQPL
jgi:ferrochelatase